MPFRWIEQVVVSGQKSRTTESQIHGSRQAALGLVSLGPWTRRVHVAHVFMILWTSKTSQNTRMNVFSRQSFSHCGGNISPLPLPLLELAKPTGRGTRSAMMGRRYLEDHRRPMTRGQRWTSQPPQNIIWCASADSSQSCWVTLLWSQGEQ